MVNVIHSVSEKLGSVVKAARKKRNLTQKQLAERLSITPQYLMSIENRKQIPGSSLLFLIIRDLDLSADEIFYPEHGNECELVNRLSIMLCRFEEHDIELIISMLQVLLQAKCSEGVDTQCRFKCPFI